MCEKREEYEARIQELEEELSNAKSIITKIEGESICPEGTRAISPAQRRGIG